MNAEETIKILEIARSEVEWRYPVNYAIAFDEAIKAIEDKRELINRIINGLSASEFSELFCQDIYTSEECEKACQNGKTPNADCIERWCEYMRSLE